MAEIRYQDLLDRLPAEAQTLLEDMAGLHLAAGPGDRSFMLSPAAGSSGRTLYFPPGSGLSGVDPGALEDLAGHGLLRASLSKKGTPNYRISGDGVLFYRWMMREKGRPIDTVDDEVQRFVKGDAFAGTHAGAAHHLTEAFDLLRSDRTDEQTVSEIGGHLRSALFDVVADVVGGDDSSREKPIESLVKYLAVKNMPEREAAVLTALTELARVTLGLDQRLDHARDESDKDHPPVSWEEIRRACFTSAFVCYELSTV